MTTLQPHRFEAATSREALRLVREHLGPDAMVLSSQVTARGVEVLAVVESSAGPWGGPHPSPAPGGEGAIQVSSVLSSTASPSYSLPLWGRAGVGASPAPASIPSPDGILQEIHSLRGMIETKLAGLAWSEAERRDPLRGQLLRGLLAVGLSARLGRSLLADLPPHLNLAEGRSHLQAALTDRLPVLACEDTLMREGGVYALVGPTGVGKTTTTAKLAARCVLRFGPEQLALVTTDTFRMGAAEQLRLYGDILGVPVYAVNNAGELDGLLTQLQGKHMVLVDTVGMSQRDRAVADQITLLAAPRRPVKRLLLLNAASHGDTLQEVVAAYQRRAPGTPHAAEGAGLAGCIFTKLDEAPHAGALIDTAITYQLPVHYLCDGQRVPEHLHLARSADLAASVFDSQAGATFAAPFATALSASLASWQGGVTAGDEPLCPHVEAAVRGVAQPAGPSAVAGLGHKPHGAPLLGSLIHDSAELAALASALDGADLGFAVTRLAWRQWSQARSGATTDRTNDAEQRLAALKQTMHDRVQASPRWQASGPLLCASSPALEASAGCTVYLCSDDGLPLTHDTQPGEGALQFLGKDVVQLLNQAPSPASTVQRAWLAYAGANQRVWVSGQCMPVSRWLKAGAEQGGPVFGPVQPVIYRRQPARVSAGEAWVSLAPDELPVRCLVRRVVDLQGRALLHSCALASGDLSYPAETLLKWAAWRSQAQAYFKLVAVAAQQLVEWPGQPGTAHAPVAAAAAVSAASPEQAIHLPNTTALRHCLAAQTALTAWHVQSAPDTATWAAPVRRLWAQLAGKPQREPAPVTGPTLLEGLGRFVLLLDSLDDRPTAELESEPSEAATSVALTAERLCHA